MSKDLLRKYTTLPFLLDILINKRLTLSDPSLWEDRNDAFFIQKYIKEKKLETVLATCFTQRPEKFHHWKVYAGNSAGICIRFDKNRLLECFKNEKSIKADSVQYFLIKDLASNASNIDIDRLPFIKRKQYEDEAEFRIIYESKQKLYKKFFSIDINCIEKIVISPWMPNDVAKTIKKMIPTIEGCKNIKVLKTGVIESSVWKKIINNINNKLITCL